MKFVKNIINWKKYFLCGIPLFISIILGEIICYYFYVPSLLEVLFTLIGAYISFVLVEKYAVKRLYKINELHMYKDLQFYVTLEYYYDTKLKEFYVDKELGNKNLKQLEYVYNELKKSA